MSFIVKEDKNTFQQIIFSVEVSKYVFQYELICFWNTTDGHEVFMLVCETYYILKTSSLLV